MCEAVFTEPWAHPGRFDPTRGSLRSWLVAQAHTRAVDVARAERARRHERPVVVGDWSVTGPQPVSLGMLGRDGTNTTAFRLQPTITELAITEAPTSGDVAPNGEFLASGSVHRN